MVKGFFSGQKKDGVPTRLVVCGASRAVIASYERGGQLSMNVSPGKTTESILRGMKVEEDPASKEIWRRILEDGVNPEHNTVTCLTEEEAMLAADVHDILEDAGLSVGSVAYFRGDEDCPSYFDFL